MKDELIPHIGEWNERSKDQIDFFWAGYGEYGLDEKGKPAHKDCPGDAQPLTPENRWWWSPSAFTDFIEELQAQTRWRDSTGTDIILINAWFDTAEQKTKLDYSSAIVFQLERATADGAIADVKEFAIRTFEFAKWVNHSPEAWDQVWQYSNNLGRHVMKGGLAAVIEHKQSSPWVLFKRLRHFAMRDISI